MTRSSSIVCDYLHSKLQAAHALLSDSGHGGQTPDKDGDETDGFDEGVRRGPAKCAHH